VAPKAPRKKEEKRRKKKRKKKRRREAERKEAHEHAFSFHARTRAYLLYAWQ
jgi:hypothetical protein